MGKFWRFLFLTPVAFLVCFGVFLSPANATLIGDEIFAASSHVSPDSAIIGAGVEFIWPDFAFVEDPLTFDFAESTLTINNGGVTGWAGGGNIVFSGFDVIISAVSIVSNTGFSGNIVDNFSFTGSSITLDFDLGECIASNSILVFDIETASAVPLPAPILLLGSGMLGLIGTRKILKK